MALVPLWRVGVAVELLLSLLLLLLLLLVVVVVVLVLPACAMLKAAAPGRGSKDHLLLVTLHTPAPMLHLLTPPGLHRRGWQQGQHAIWPQGGDSSATCLPPSHGTWCMGASQPNQGERRVRF